MNKLFTSFIFMTLLSLSAYCASNYTYSQNQPEYGYDVNYGYEYSNLQGHAVYVPAGITCKGILSQDISSQSAVVGQTVSVVLDEDFTYNGSVVAPVGSTVNGTIASNQKAGYGNRNAKMMIRFTTIQTPYGNTIPINAVVATSDSTGLLKGGTVKDSAKEYAKDAAIGAGAGAVLGTAMGALSSGSVGRGAVYGTALGAGLGAAKRASNKGASINIPANSVIDLYFTQPVTFTAQ